MFALVVNPLSTAGTCGGVDAGTRVRDGQGMRWEERLLDVFEDLEQQAEGLALSERDLEVAELSRAEYVQVTLEDRLHASTRLHVSLQVTGVGTVSGTLARAGAGWCLVVPDGEPASVAGQEWIVPVPAVLRVAGASDRALDEDHRPLPSRLGLGSALRAVAAERGELRVHLRDGSVLRGTVTRVGADFVEIAHDRDGERLLPAGPVRPGVLLPFTAVAALRRG